MTAPNQTTDSLPSLTFNLRLARWDDAPAVTKLIYDVCLADGDPTVAVTEEELRREWQRESFRLETDAWVVEASSGQIVGYEEFVNRHAHAYLNGDGYVHPNFKGRGIGTAMMRALDERALLEMKLAEPGLRVYIRNGMAIGDTTAREMHAAEGYCPIRFSWRMEIQLDGVPPAPAWPEGVELRPFEKGVQDRLVFDAEEDAFRDHWGSTPGNFTDWQMRKINHDEFDPSLWYVAWDGEEIAGVSLCRFRNDIGWVGTLGVRRPWRKRGLGLTLLTHSFREFHQRGTPTVGLGVDASNPTGATRLYQKAGMSIASEYVIYEKELRPGRELAEMTE